MSIITDLGEPINPPDYNGLFDFIESEEGQQYLLKAERGNFSFNSSMLTLKALNALPLDSSKKSLALCTYDVHQKNSYICSFIRVEMREYTPGYRSNI